LLSIFFQFLDFEGALSVYYHIPFLYSLKHTHALTHTNPCHTCKL